MEAFLISALVVVVAEMGDKTQVMGLLLATRTRAPLSIMAGIALASAANHGLAATAGLVLASLISDALLRGLVAAAFVLMALWMLKPEEHEAEETPDGPPKRYGPFLAALTLFFLAEMGDKTQIATIALAARFETLLWVVAGSTLGMLAANAPGVLLGHILGARLPLVWIRRASALLFIVLAVGVLLQG